MLHPHSFGKEGRCGLQGRSGPHGFVQRSIFSPELLDVRGHHELDLFAVDVLHVDNDRRAVDLLGGLGVLAVDQRQDGVLHALVALGESVLNNDGGQETVAQSGDLDIVGVNADGNDAFLHVGSTQSVADAVAGDVVAGIDADEVSADSVDGVLGISLSNLRTDYIDLYYLHRINEMVRLEDVATVMGRLIQEGLIRGWGLSQVSADQIRTAHEVTPLSAVQNIYSMVERDCETEIFPVCLEEGIGVVPFSPIASGFLSGKVTAQEQFGFDDVRKFVPQLSKENIEANQPILDLLHRFAVEKKATNAQISLAWMLHKYPNVVPIPGSKNQERILENLGAWNVTLSDDEFRQLQSALDECKVHGHRGCVETEQTSFGKQWSEGTDK